MTNSKHDAFVTDFRLDHTTIDGCGLIYERTRAPRRARAGAPGRNTAGDPPPPPHPPKIQESRAAGLKSNSHAYTLLRIPSPGSRQ